MLFPLFLFNVFNLTIDAQDNKNAIEYACCIPSFNAATRHWKYDSTSFSMICVGGPYCLATDQFGIILKQQPRQLYVYSSSNTDTFEPPESAEKGLITF